MGRKITLVIGSRDPADKERLLRAIIDSAKREHLAVTLQEDSDKSGERDVRDRVLLNFDNEAESPNTAESLRSRRSLSLVSGAISGVAMGVALGVTVMGSSTGVWSWAIGGALVGLCLPLAGYLMARRASR